MSLPAWFTTVAAILAACGSLFGQPTSATKEDSGWVSPFNGKDFNGFYIFVKGAAPQVRTVDNQTLYNIDSGMIHAPNGPNAHLITARDYSWYRVRVDYRYSTAAGSENAGLVLHIDKAQAYGGKLTASDNRPTSIEVNMRRAEASPWTLWSAIGMGPYITTTAKAGTDQYLPRSQGGVPWTNDPWGVQRVVFSNLPNPEHPLGQWNHGEADMYGDSGTFRLNGSLRCEGWDFQVRVNPNNPTPRVPYSKGGIGLQSEGHEVWYRAFEVMELDSLTRQPLTARKGCTDRKAANYDPRAVVDNGSCGGVGINPGAGKKPGLKAHRLRGYSLAGRKMRRP